MITKLFGWVALFHGAITLSVFVTSIVILLHRGKHFTPQFYLALVLFLGWIASNVTYVSMRGYPTTDDLSFPIIDVLSAAAIILVGVLTKQLIFWMKLLWAVTTAQLLFHIPYLVTYGKIISHYQYHLTLNIIFDIQNLIVFAALFVPRRIWLRLDFVSENLVDQYIYYPIQCMIPKTKKRTRHFSVDTKSKLVV